MNASGTPRPSWPILVIDDEIGVADTLARKAFLHRAGGDPLRFEFSTGQATGQRNDVGVAVKAVSRGWPFPEGDRWSLILLDVRFPSSSGTVRDDRFGFEILDALRGEFGPDLPVVMLTAEDERRRESGERGATGFLAKEEVSEERLAEKRAERGLFPDVRGILEGSSLPFLLLLRSLRQFSRFGGGELLLLGESGAGKTELARFVHDESGRKGRFVPWSADPATRDLHYDQLFGHWAGAHSTATRPAAGKAEQAHGGTLFLDEVAELAPETQVQLLSFRDRDARGLRALRRQGNPPPRLGGGGAPPDRSRLDLRGEYDADRGLVLVDVLCLFATNRDLRDPRQRSETGFRSDLFHALGAPVVVPPLRERREDILPLFEAFLNRPRQSMGWRPAALDRGVEEHLLSYAWPGNLRELRRAAEHVNVQLGRDFDVVSAHHLPEFLLKEIAEPSARTPTQTSHVKAAPPRIDPATQEEDGACEPGDLCRSEIALLARTMKVLRRGVEVSAEAWRPGALESRISPTRVAAFAIGTQIPTTDAQRVLKEVLGPLFKPTKFQQKRWDDFDLYRRLRDQAQADPVLAALWRYGAGEIKRDEMAQRIARELADRAVEGDGV